MMYIYFTTGLQEIYTTEGDLIKILSRLQSFAKKPIALFLLLFLLAGVQMLGGIDSFFDPQEFMTFLNPLGRGDSVGEYFTEGWSSISAISGEKTGFFRPLTSLSYVPEYFIWGSRPLFYRITSLLLLAFTALTAGRICRLFGGSGKASAYFVVVASGSVFAVWWISGRGDILAPLFGLLALESTIKLIKTDDARIREMLLPALFCFLAVASKEQGIASIPAVILAYVLLPGESHSRRKTVIFVTSVLTVLLIAFFVRYLLFKGVGGYEALTQFRHVLPHMGTLILQLTGTESVKWDFLRSILPFSFFIPVVFYLASSKENYRRGLLLLLLIPLFGFQSLIADTCEHYVLSPLLIFCILLGLSLEYMGKRYHVSFVLTFVPLIAVTWFLWGIANVETLDRLSQSHEVLYNAAEDIWVNKNEAFISPVLILPEYSREELKLPLYFDHIAGGDCGLDFTIVEINCQPDLATVESTALVWNGQTLIIHNSEE